MSTKIVDHGDIPIDLIAPNPEQPRQEFDKAGLEELAQSIREMGVIQPIVVELSPDPDVNHRYILHAGERRLRAAKMAGLEVIPAIVSGESSQSDRLVRALVENVQREDMSPLDVARAYARMHDEMGMTDQAIADRVGKSRSAVANARRLLELPQDVQDLANQEGISERMLMALLPVYQLPEDAMQRAEKRWSSPKRLVEDIRAGTTVNSDQVRSRVLSIIRDGTKPLNKAIFPTDHEFDENGLCVQSPECDACIERVKAGREWRCPIEACYKAKEQRWIAETMQAASEVYGIPILPEDAEWNEYSSFYGETSAQIAGDIITAGCENLRLQFQTWDGGYRLSDYPQIAVVCQHGTDDDKQCKCLVAGRAKLPPEPVDPERIERDRNQAEVQRLTDVCGRVLGAAIDQRNAEAWRWMVSVMMPVQVPEGEEIACLAERIGRHMVHRRISWDARQDPVKARSDVKEMFDKVGLAMPDVEDAAAHILRKFKRIKGWIDNLNHDQVTIEQVHGNLNNLEALTDEFDQISDGQIDNEAFDGFLVDLAEAWEQLDTLRDELYQNNRLQLPEVAHG
jgi:ParB/RepB/Spo0J family partition protein